MSKQNEESAFRSSVTSKFAWCLNPITGQETQPHLLCRERSPSPSQSLVWVESATPHKGFCEVIGGNEPITAIHVHKKKKIKIPEILHLCLQGLIGFLTALTNSLKSNMWFIDFALAQILRGQRTMSGGLGRWVWSNSLHGFGMSCCLYWVPPPWGFTAYRIPCQRPRLQRRETMWNLSHSNLKEDIWTWM